VIVTVALVITHPPPPRLDDNYLVRDCGHLVSYRVKQRGKVSNLAIVMLDCRLANFEVEPEVGCFREPEVECFREPEVGCFRKCFRFLEAAAQHFPPAKTSAVGLKIIIFCSIVTSKMEIMENFQRHV